MRAGSLPAPPRHSPHARTVEPDAPDFPADLLAGALPPCPARLHLRGRAELLPPPARCVALVGARRCTDDGRHVARSLAAALAREGIVVVSGLALGIDAAAHEGALDAGGQTIAVLASPVERPTPRANLGLAEEIASGGGWLVSEHGRGGAALGPAEFPRRNRLVVALAGAVVVVEAGLPSGTLTTVAHALRAGRPVGAVPGSVLSPASAGANELIRCGAAPVLGAADVLSLLGRTGRAPRRPGEEDGDGDEDAVLRGVPGVSASVDAWLSGTSIPQDRARAALLRLLARGALRRVGRGHVARCLFEPQALRADPGAGPPRTFERNVSRRGS